MTAGAKGGGQEKKRKQRRRECAGEEDPEAKTVLTVVPKAATTADRRTARWIDWKRAEIDPAGRRLHPRRVRSQGPGAGGHCTAPTIRHAGGRAGGHGAPRLSRIGQLSPSTPRTAPRPRHPEMHTHTPCPCLLPWHHRLPSSPYYHHLASSGSGSTGLLCCSLRQLC